MRGSLSEGVFQGMELLLVSKNVFAPGMIMSSLLLSRKFPPSVAALFPSLALLSTLVESYTLQLHIRARLTANSTLPFQDGFESD